MFELTKCYKDIFELLKNVVYCLWLDLGYYNGKLAHNEPLNLPGLEHGPTIGLHNVFLHGYGSLWL